MPIYPGASRALNGITGQMQSEVPCALFVLVECAVNLFVVHVLQQLLQPLHGLPSAGSAELVEEYVLVALTVHPEHQRVMQYKPGRDRFSVPRRLPSRGSEGIGCYCVDNGQRQR